MKATDMQTEIIQQHGPVHAAQGQNIFDPARQALLNGCVNFARGLLGVAVSISLTPFIISHLGASRFGVWSLLGLFVTYVTLVDFGISGATARFIGGLSQREAGERLNRVFTTAIGLTIAAAAGAMLFGPLLRQSLERQLGRFGLFGEDATLFFMGAVALYSVGIVANGLSYVLLGLHRLDVANYIAAAVLLLQAGGIVAVLRAGLGLRGLIAATTGTAALSIIAYSIAAKKLVSELRFHWKNFDLSTMKELLTFGVFLQAYALVGVYYIYIGKAVVSLRFPLAAVAAYEVALRLPLLLRQGMSTVLGPMMPAVAHLDSGGNTERVKTLLLKALRYSVVLGAPLFIGLAVFAEPVIRLWVGPGFASSVLPLRILSIAFGLSVFPELVWYFLVGLGRQRLAMILSLLQVTCGTLLSYLLARQWGLNGVALGVLCTSLAGAVLYAALLAKQRFLSFSDLPLLLALKVAAAGTFAFLLIFGLFGRFHLAYWNFATAIFLASALYFLSLVKTGVLEREERIFLRRFVPYRLHFLC